MVRMCIGSQRCFDPMNHSSGCFANKFHSYMQRLTAYPARVGNAIANLLNELENPLADCRIQIERNECPHCQLSIANHARRDIIK